MERVFGYLMPLLVCRVEVRFAIVASFRSTGCFVGEAVSYTVSSGCVGACVRLSLLRSAGVQPHCVLRCEQ